MRTLAKCLEQISGPLFRGYVSLTTYSSHIYAPVKLKSAFDRMMAHILSITSTGSHFTSVLQASLIEYHNGRITKQCPKEHKVLRPCFKAIELRWKRELITASSTLLKWRRETCDGCGGSGFGVAGCNRRRRKGLFLSKLLPEICSKCGLDWYTVFALPASPNVFVILRPRPR
jgi:hypothetical protein